MNASLSLLDAGFLHLERPCAPLQIGAILSVDGTALHEDVVAMLGERLPGLPRFTQRLRMAPFSLSRPQWRAAEDFDPREHVYSWSLSATDGDPTRCRPLYRLLAEPLPQGRPLWDLHLFESPSTPTTTVLFRAHHCMLDGIGGLAALAHLLDGEGEGLPSRASGAAAGYLEHLEQEAKGWRAAALRIERNVRVSARVAASTWRAARSARDWIHQEVPKQRWNCRVSHERQLATTRLSLDRIHEIRTARNCRFNDVVLSVIGGGLARYLRRTGAQIDVPLQVLVPVNRRSNGDRGEPAGNRIAAMRVAVPVDGDDESLRLARIQEATRPAMAGRAWEDSEAWLALLDALPSAVIAPAARAVRLGRVANLIVTNVAGPREKQSFCGRPVQEIRPIVPIYHDLGLGVAALSYGGELSLTLHADPRRVRDLDGLAEDVAEAGTALYLDTAALHHRNPVVRLARGGGAPRGAGGSLQEAGS